MCRRSIPVEDQQEYLRTRIALTEDDEDEVHSELDRQFTASWTNGRGAGSLFQLLEEFSPALRSGGGRFLAGIRVRVETPLEFTPIVIGNVGTHDDRSRDRALALCSY